MRNLIRAAVITIVAVAFAGISWGAAAPSVKGSTNPAVPATAPVVAVTGGSVGGVQKTIPGAPEKSTVPGVKQMAIAETGTVKDTSTGLIWLKNANCFAAKTWDAATSAAKSLKAGDCGLSDGSKAGDWYLPNREQIQSIVQRKHLFSNVQSDWYWSSSNYKPGAGYVGAWCVDMSDGSLGYVYQTISAYVWPVRAGQ